MFWLLPTLASNYGLKWNVLGHYSLQQEAVEELPSIGGKFAIKTESVFIEIIFKVRTINHSLVGPH